MPDGNGIFMILAAPGEPKLTYCLNVHPGETWQDQFEALRTTALELKRKLEVPGNFGVGLRISARALENLKNPGAVAEAAAFFKQVGLDPFTFNGFPFGTFHGSRVKENVYQPDWKSRERVEYTKGLGKIMAEWLAKGEGSISTVPCAFSVPPVTREDEILMGRNLAECAAFFHELEEKIGPRIILGLEPEPACSIETTPQFIRFYREIILVHGIDFLRTRLGFSSALAEEILRRHLGICLDTCHAAIQFETIEDSIRTVLGAGIPIAKIQISNALEVTNSGEARKALEAFMEPVYLHQVRARLPDGEIRSWTDLPEGLKGLAQLPEGISARVHFHVPLFWEGREVLRSTQGALTPGFWNLCREGVTKHLEMETYTFSVLPETAGKYDLGEMLEREYRWTLRRLSLENGTR